MVYKKREIIAGISVFVILALKLVGYFMPSARLWGVNQLAYFSLMFAIAYILGIIALILLITYKDKLPFVEIPYRGVKSVFIKLPRWLTSAAGLLIAAVLFYMLRDVTNLLGDGILRLTELANFHYIPSTEPLDCLVHYAAYEYILKQAGYSPLLSFQLLSYLAGLLYIWGVWLLSKQLKEHGISQGLTIAYMLGWGGFMMFFGYVENYAFASALIVFLIYFCLEYFYNSRGLIALLALFLIAFFMHNLTFYLVPALLYLLYIKRKKNPKGYQLGALMIIFVVLIWMVFSYSSKEQSAFLLPVSSSDPGYLIWSPAHILDTLNELFLISPVFLVLLWLQQKGAKRRENQLLTFFWITAIPGILLLLFLDPKLGMPRDWDLFAFPLLGLHVALLIGVDWQKTGRFIIISAAAVIPIAFTALWILINCHEGRAVERYKDIVSLDKERSVFGYEQLAQYFRRQQRWEETEQAYEHSIKIRPHYRTCFNLGYIQYEFGKLADAERNLVMSLKLEPRFARAKKYLGLLYLKTKHYEHALDYLNQYVKTPEGQSDAEAKEALQKLNQFLNGNQLEK